MSRLAGLDRGGYRDWLADEDFSGVVHVAGDADEEPLTIALGLADRAADKRADPLRASCERAHRRHDQSTF